MVIEVRDIAPQAYTAEEGLAVAKLVRHSLSADRETVVSFAGIRDVPSSFINGAFISLLDEYDSDWLKGRLKIRSATRQTADMIRRCFENADRRRKA